MKEHSKEDLERIKNNLSIDEIENLLSELGAEPYRQNDNIIISRTICHCGNSHKLFYYDNTKLFRCYTECSDTFDIFQLVIKVQHILNKEFTLPDAVAYIKHFFNIVEPEEDFFKEIEILPDWTYLKQINNNQYKKENKKVELNIFDNKILNFLPTPRILPWEHEGINKDIISAYNIKYDPSAQGIVIPHYDMEGHLIGIRERTLIKENEIYGKYRPAILNHKMYNHPLGFHLYNLNNSKNNIQRIKKVIVFEGEKSTLKYASYFGIENDISVAVCGSSLTQYQFQLLYQLGINELIIAFDKQFQDIGDQEYKGWVKKLLTIAKKFKNYCKISFLFDTNNLLNYKDSPIDQGPDVFTKLFKERLDEDGK